MYCTSIFDFHNLETIIITINNSKLQLHVQWNPSITDTIGEFVLLMEVSFVEGSFNTIKIKMGQEQCPL